MSITMAIGFFQESVYRFAYFFSIIPKKLLTKMSRRKSSFWKSFYILTRNALFITRTSQQKIDLRIPCEFGHSATYSQQTGQFSRVSPCLQWQEMHPTTLIHTNSLENERMERCITFMCLRLLSIICIITISYGFHMSVDVCMHFPFALSYFNFQ